MKAIPYVLLLPIALMVLFTRCEKEPEPEPEPEPLTVKMVTDPNFLNALIEMGVDADQNNFISPTEAESVTELNVSSRGIEDLSGIGLFVNLLHLNCRDNLLASLDVSKNTSLATLYCNNNQLKTLLISEANSLVNLKCYNNQISSLNVSTHTQLIDLRCYINNITTLDVSKNAALEHLDCNRNQLINLDVSKNNSLVLLNCYWNQLSALNVSNNPVLITLKCNLNQFNSLDIPQNTVLEWLNCSSNPVTSLDLSNNSSIGHELGILTGYHSCDLSIGDMPSLKNVCVWELPFPPDGFRLCVEGSPNVYYTSECSAKQNRILNPQNN